MLHGNSVVEKRPQPRDLKTGLYKNCLQEERKEVLTNWGQKDSTFQITLQPVVPPGFASARLLPTDGLGHVPSSTKVECHSFLSPSEISPPPQPVQG